jgi:hypothetical protein
MTDQPPDRPRKAPPEEQPSDRPRGALPAEPRSGVPGGALPEEPRSGVGGEAPEQPTSGLRNPAAAVRGVAIGALCLESIVILLSLQPIRILDPDVSGGVLGLVASLAVACLVVAGLLRYPWGWHAGTALQVAFILTGFFQYAMFILGGLFLLVWLYVLKIRSDLRKPARFDH